MKVLLNHGKLKYYRKMTEWVKIGGNLDPEGLALCSVLTCYDLVFGFFFLTYLMYVNNLKSSA